MLSTRLKLLTLAACVPLVLCGCGDEFSGNTYSSTQAKHVSNVQTGTISSMRNVAIKHEGVGGGAALGAGAGALAGGLIGNAFSGSARSQLVGAGIGALAGGVAGNAIQNRPKAGIEYIVSLDNGGQVAITQGPTPQMSVGQRVNVIYDASGAGRVAPL